MSFCFNPFGLVLCLIILPQLVKNKKQIQSHVDYKQENENKINITQILDNLLVDYDKLKRPEETNRKNFWCIFYTNFIIYFHYLL